MRVAQGNPGNAGVSLLEQMLLLTFGKTKVRRVRAAARIKNKPPRSGTKTHNIN